MASTNGCSNEKKNQNDTHLIDSFLQPLVTNTTACLVVKLNGFCSCNFAQQLKMAYVIVKKPCE